MAKYRLVWGGNKYVVEGFCFVFTKVAKYRSQAANFCKSMSYSTDLDTFSGHPQANYLNFKAKLRRNLPFASLKKNPHDAALIGSKCKFILSDIDIADH